LSKQEVKNTTHDIQPVDLIIHEPIGELLLTLEGDKLIVTPSKAFIHAIAERMAQAESALRERTAVLDRWVAKARGAAESRLDHFFGEFPLSECNVELRETRLHLRVGKVRTSFGERSFDVRQAESFVRQLNRARVGDL
jgi:hypothetical protein